MTNESPEEKPELVVDSDWKSQVEAENAAIDEKNRSEKNSSTAEEEGQSQDIDPSQIPPPSFTLLVTMFSTQAMSALGLIPHPITGKREIQLALAKHYIDLLGVIDEKSKGNLDDSEDKLIETTLHELRMIYVQQSSTIA